MKIKRIIIFTIIFVLQIAIYLVIDNHTVIFGHSIYVVQNKSIDGININDIVIVKNNSDFDYKDVIVYSLEDSNYLVRRVVYVDNERVVTKSDYNENNDKSFNRDLVTGKVVTSIRFMLIIRIIAIILLFIVIIVVFNLSKIITKFTKKSSE